MRDAQSALSGPRALLNDYAINALLEEIQLLSQTWDANPQLEAMRAGVRAIKDRDKEIERLRTAIERATYEMKFVPGPAAKSITDQLREVLA